MKSANNTKNNTTDMRPDGRTRKAKITTLIALTSFCAALVFATIFCNSFVCYAVSYDGTDLGQVQSRSELISAIDTAEALATDILGEECSLAGSLDVTPGIGTASDSASTLTDMLLENMDGITKEYAITVGGTPVGTLSTSDELFEILDSILVEYETPNTTSIEFSQNVSVEYMFVNENLENNPEKIAWLLSPENTDSPYSLTVISSEVTDVVEALAYTTEYEYDDTKYSDEITVLQDGSDGTMNISYLTTKTNGQETSTIQNGTYVVSDPVNEKLLVGSIPGSRTDSTGTYIWPAEGSLTSTFGYRTVAIGSSNHKGIDIANSVGTPIYSADGGTVIFAEYWDGSGYGNLIEIQHDNGDITYYGHLSSILVSEGDKVAQGDLIGEMGTTGNVSGSHLHFEIRPAGGEPTDPLDYLQ